MFEPLLGRSLLDAIAIVGPRRGLGIVTPSDRVARRPFRSGGRLAPIHESAGRFSWRRCSCCLWEVDCARALQWYLSIEPAGAESREYPARVRTLAALALQLAALVALSLSLLGVSWLDARSKARWLVLVDRSESVPRAAGDRRSPTSCARRTLRQAASCSPRVRGQSRRASRRQRGPGAGLEPSSTDIEAALDAALAAHAQAAFDSAVDRSPTARRTPATPHARCALRATPGCRCTGSPSVAHRRRLASSKSGTERARAGQRIQISVQLPGRWIGRCASRQPRAPRGETQTSEQ